MMCRLQKGGLTQHGIFGISLNSFFKSLFLRFEGEHPWKFHQGSLATTVWLPTVV